MSYFEWKSAKGSEWKIWTRARSGNIHNLGRSGKNREKREKDETKKRKYLEWVGKSTEEGKRGARNNGISETRWKIRDTWKQEKKQEIHGE